MASYFFSEMPYAAALNEEFLLNRCSNCFAYAKSPLPCVEKCAQVVYCDEMCHEIDRPWHENECLAYRNGQRRVQSQYFDIQVRLLGRILTRQKLDHGVASLSKDFPRHLAKERCFGDLISHEQKTKAKNLSRYQEVARNLELAFLEFFENTPLATTKPRLLSHVYHVSKVNGFSVTAVHVSGDPRWLFDMGEAVYLNVSRFNHSCRPTLLFSFSNARLVVRRIDQPTENTGTEKKSGWWTSKRSKNDTKSKSSSSMSKKEFNSMTFNYGFGTARNYGSALSLTSQRIQSMQERYFFRCRCDLCRDERTTKLQLDASNVECVGCGQPYVWRNKNGKAKVALKKLCKCRIRDDNVEQWAKTAEIQEEIQRLNYLWPMTMECTTAPLTCDQTVSIFEPLFRSAEKVWHPIYNLRYGQIGEKLYTARCVEVKQLEDDNKPFDDKLASALEWGEKMLPSFLHYAMSWDLTIGLALYRMANLYLQLEGGDEKTKRRRASELHKLAAKVWKENGEDQCEKFLIDLADSILVDGGVETAAASQGQESETAM